MLHSLFTMMVFTAVYIYGNYAADIVLSTTPQPKNVSVGTMVEYMCATPESGLTNFLLTITTSVDGLVIVSNDTVLDNGDRQLTLSFIAPSEPSNINIQCLALRVGTTTDVTQIDVPLMIQGSLSAVDNLMNNELSESCALRLSWTAPYTLQGVPINYYTINITRQSDGAVLKSDSTNTTEYLYSVSSLGETLEVVVAAVNDVGTGTESNITVSVPSINFNFNITTDKLDNVRRNNDWNYTFNIQEMPMCENAIDKYIVEICLNSLPWTCFNASETTFMLPERAVFAKFANLVENKQYSAFVYVQFNGGVTWKSQSSVNITTFDVQKIEVDPMSECVNIMVTYVNGHETPPNCSVIFKCTTDTIEPLNITIKGTSLCTNEIGAHESYNVFAIDGDVEADLNMLAALAPATVTNISVASFSPPTTTVSLTAVTPTTTMITTVESDNIIVAIVAGAIGAVVIIFLLVIIIVTPIVIVVLLSKKTQKVNASMANDDVQLETVIVDQRELSIQGTTYASVQTQQTAHAPPSVENKPLIYDIVDGTTTTENTSIERLDNMVNMELNHASLFELLQPISSVWYRLGEALGLSPCLEKIKLNNARDDLRLQALLHEWESQKIRGFTWGSLITALQSNRVGMTHLAQKLQEKLYYQS